MTASLFNNQNGNFANVVDGFVYPQFIGYALRAPTTQDIYNPGTRWQDNSVNPAVQYYTVGAGLWYEFPNGTFGVNSVTGTANEITASPTVGAVVLSIPAVFIAPGSIASTTTLTGGTGITATTGNIAASAGNVSASGTVTGGTGVTATTGNLTATAGNLALNGVSSKINIDAAAPATASVGTTAALTAGAIVVSTTAITASSLVFFSTNTLGTVTVPQAYRVSAITPGVSFTIQSQDATDTSTVNYWIIN